AQLSSTYVGHLDRCLGCMACVTACPSGVQYEKLIETTRAQIERNYPRSFADRIFRRLIFALFPHPQRLRIMALPLFLYQRSGFTSLRTKPGFGSLPPYGFELRRHFWPICGGKSFLSGWRRQFPVRAQSECG